MAAQKERHQISGVRMITSIGIGLAFGGVSLTLLVCRNDFEGGVAVSLFTLGLVCACLVFVYPKVSSIVIAGHEIKLQKLTMQAEDEIARLKESRLNLYRVALRMVMKHSGGFASGWESDGRIPEILELLGYIDKEGAIPKLASEIRGKIHPILTKQIDFVRRAADDHASLTLPEIDREVPPPYVSGSRQLIVDNTRPTYSKCWRERPTGLRKCSIIMRGSTPCIFVNIRTIRQYSRCCSVAQMARSSSFSPSTHVRLREMEELEALHFGLRTSADPVLPPKS